MHSLGIEHEGYLAHGHHWYTEEQYQSSAKLVRYLAAKYGIPLDRDHIIGHEEIPAENAAGTIKQHYDPGPFWNWSYYFSLLGAPLYADRTDRATRGPEIVAIMPKFAENYHQLTDCTGGCDGLPEQGSNIIYLYTEPRDGAPLLSDPALHPTGLPGTTNTYDWSARAVVGQRFVVADRRKDWTGVWFAGQVGWFPDPDGKIGAPAAGEVITPAADRDSIPVYGTAFPERAAYPPHVEIDDIEQLQYRILAGQRYVVTNRHTSDDFQPTTSGPYRRVLVVGKRQLVEISYNPRPALLDVDDIGTYPT
jgi:hypothetical protein